MSARSLSLVSGLSILKATSFTRQLRLLAAALRARGFDVQLAGRGAAAVGPEGERDLPDVPAFDRWASGSAAVILLGYPDQFPSLAAAGPNRPTFLWAQFSRPPEIALGGAVPVPLTPATAGHLAAAGLRPTPPIPHAVDCRLFRPAAGARPAGGARIGTVGANTRRKRFDRLLDAAVILGSRGRRFELVVKTDRAVAPGGFDLPAMVESRGLAGLVEIDERPLPAAGLADFYRSLDLYVHTAEWEGFGIPVIEAMACGLPVVCPRGQGPGEIVPYHDLLVTSGEVVMEGASALYWVDPPAVAAAVERALDDSVLRERLGRLGREEAEQRYDIEVVADRWLALLATQPAPARRPGGA